MLPRNNFLSQSFSRIGSTFSRMSEPTAHDETRTDSQYRAEALHNFNQSKSQFMWGETSKILTMAMSAVLMGGITGTVVSMLSGSAIGMGMLAVGGLALAAGAIGAAYMGFKSRGMNFINVNETNAELAARKQAQELTPTLSKAVGKEVGHEVKSAIKEAFIEARSEQSLQPHQLANASVSPGSSVEAAVVDVPFTEVRRDLSRGEAIEINAKPIPQTRITTNEMEHNARIQPERSSALVHMAGA